MSAELPWHAAYPAPRGAASSISREELLQWIREGKQAGKDFLLVDLRRTDYEGGTIQGSLNLPAQSLYPTIPTLYSLVSNSSVKYVIWYCGSSAGRGTRASGWFADYLEDQQDTEVKSLVLSGGIKGWAAAGPDYTSLMDGYDASVWTK
ncbi:Rhodanese-like [Penicillium camemberti]|uniref:Rhodanese-like n=1 Tax=Penicillium camemberti (strain FM 013) TaxID=1429867 RepID=A0A0G4NZS6_PENC3|nr:Rhodanese-like [Penicillium camemberti]